MSNEITKTDVSNPLAGLEDLAGVGMASTEKTAANMMVPKYQFIRSANHGAMDSANPERYIAGAKVRDYFDAVRGTVIGPEISFLLFESPIETVLDFTDPSSDYGTKDRYLVVDGPTDKPDEISLADIYKDGRDLMSTCGKVLRAYTRFVGFVLQPDGTWRFGTADIPTGLATANRAWAMKSRVDSELLLSGSLYIFNSVVTLGSDDTPFVTAENIRMYNPRMLDVSPLFGKAGFYGPDEKEAADNVIKNLVPAFKAYHSTPVNTGNRKFWGLAEKANGVEEEVKTSSKARSNASGLRGKLGK